MTSPQSLLLRVVDQDALRRISALMARLIRTKCLLVSDSANGKHSEREAQTTQMLNGVLLYALTFNAQ